MTRTQRYRLISARDAKRIAKDPSITPDVLAPACARLLRWLHHHFASSTGGMALHANHDAEGPSILLVWRDGVRTPELMEKLQQNWSVDPVRVIPLRHWSDEVRTDVAVRLACWMGIPRILTAEEDERAAVVSIEWGALPIGGRLVREWYYLVLEEEIAIRDCPRLGRHELRAMFESDVPEWQQEARRRLIALSIGSARPQD